MVVPCADRRDGGTDELQRRWRAIYRRGRRLGRSAYPLVGGELAKSHGAATQNISRILAFKIGGTATLPPAAADAGDEARSAADAEGPASIGRAARHCLAPLQCVPWGSAASGGLVPDLRYSAQLKDDAWYDNRAERSAQDNGMVSFADVLAIEDATDIRNYVIKRANETVAVMKAEAESAPAPHKTAIGRPHPECCAPTSPQRDGEGIGHHLLLPPLGEG